MPWAAPKLPWPPGKWGIRRGRGRGGPTSPAGRGRRVRGAGQGDEVLQNSFEGEPLGVGAQEVRPDAGEAVEQVVLGERGQVALADTGERGVHAAVGQVSDVLVQGPPRRFVQVLEGRRDSGEDEAEGRGAEEQSRSVGRADVAGRRGGDPPVGGAPGAAVTADRLDVQQADPGGAVGEGLHCPRLVRRRGAGWARWAVYCSRIAVVAASAVIEPPSGAGGPRFVRAGWWSPRRAGQRPGPGRGAGAGATGRRRAVTVVGQGRPVGVDGGGAGPPRFDDRRAAGRAASTESPFGAASSSTWARRARFSRPVPWGGCAPATPRPPRCPAPG